MTKRTMSAARAHPSRANGPPAYAPPPSEPASLGGTTWEEPASCHGPRGERHAVRLGHDGRVCYFGEANLPGEWKLENVPFPNSVAGLGISCAADGTPFIACVSDNGDLYLAWREGENQWDVDCIGKNALPNEPVDLSAEGEHKITVSFQCWNPATDMAELHFVEYGRRYCKSAIKSQRAASAEDRPAFPPRGGPGRRGR